MSDFHCTFLVLGNPLWFCYSVARRYVQAFASTPLLTAKVSPVAPGELWHPEGGPGGVYVGDANTMSDAWQYLCGEDMWPHSSERESALGCWARTAEEAEEDAWVDEVDQAWAEGEEQLAEQIAEGEQQLAEAIAELAEQLAGQNPLGDQQAPGDVEQAQGDQNAADEQQDQQAGQQAVQQDQAEADGQDGAQAEEPDGAPADAAAEEPEQWIY